MPDEEQLMERARQLMEKLDREARTGGYNLNPDEEITLYLCRGLVVNIDNYGYMGCPCRLMTGDREQDLDVICPCDYRDPDLEDYGCCYCSLYVSDAVVKGEAEAQSIPERRPDDPQNRAQAPQQDVTGENKTWRCRVCGYLCAREEPPLKCPICKADKDRFEEYPLG